MEVQLAEDAASILSFFALLVIAILVWRIHAAPKRALRRKREMLEAYLKAAPDGGMRTMAQIKENVGLSEEDALAASFDNPNVARRSDGHGQLGFAWGQKPR